MNAALIASLFPAQAGAAGQAQAPKGGHRRRFARPLTWCRSARWCATGEGGSSAIWRRRISSSRKAGSSRKILDFRAQSDGPVKLALLFDISGSMRVGTKAVDARQVARHLFSALKPARRSGRLRVRHASAARDGLHAESVVPRGVARQASSRPSVRPRSTTRSRKPHVRSRSKAETTVRCSSAAPSWCSPTASTHAAG